MIEATVSQLPFRENTFDLVPAVETHFWWPDLPAGMTEIFRVLKPGETLAIVAEVYKGAQTRMAALVEKYLPLSGMKFLTVDEHRELFENAGYSEVKLATESGKGWITVIGKKPV
jgi:ubiquinone/menaquinone biosynthesis C-methylase UbiE